MLNKISKRLFGLFVVEEAVFVKSDFFVEPAQQELLGNNVFVNQVLHEGWGVLIKFILVLSDKVKNNRLEEMVLSNFALALYQIDEHLLIFGKVLQDVSSSREQTTKGSEVKEINWQVVLFTAIVKEISELVVVDHLLFIQLLNLGSQGIYTYD